MSEYAINPFDHLAPHDGPYPTVAMPHPFNRQPVFSTMGRGPRGEQGERGFPGEASRKDFETVAKMVAEQSLENGDICRTLGFYSIGDNGAATYIVRSSGVAANGIDIIELDNNLLAVLVPENEGYYANQLGMRNDNSTDNTPILETFLKSHIDATIMFDCGIYRFSPLSISANTIATGKSADYVPGFSLIGSCFSFPNIRMINYAQSGSTIDYSTFYENDAENVTIFAPIGDQDCIFDFSVITNITLKNIMFTSISDDKLFTINDAALKLHRCNFSLFENLHFMYIEGTCIKSFNCYENRLLNSDFRICIALGDPVKHGCFEFYSEGENPGVNSSAWNICNINFEGVLSHWFYLSSAIVRNVTMSNIVGEGYAFSYEDYTGVQYTHTTFPALDINHSLSVIGIYEDDDLAYNPYCGIVFESISIDLSGFYCFEKDAEKWGLNSIVSTIDDCEFSIVINSLQLSSASTSCFIYSGSSELEGKFKSLVCNNISYILKMTMDIIPIRGTLSYLYLPNRLALSAGNNALWPYIFNYQKMMDIAPTLYNTRCRMWKQSSFRSIEIARLTPKGTNERENSAFIFSGVGVSKVTVVCKKAPSEDDPHLIVRRYDNSHNILDEVTTPLRGSVYDIYELDINETFSRLSSIVIAGNGTDIDEIYDVIVS